MPIEPFPATQDERVHSAELHAKLLDKFLEVTVVVNALSAQVEALSARVAALEAKA